MDKKNLAPALVVAVFSTVFALPIQALTLQEEVRVQSLLWHLQEGNRLTLAQFSDYQAIDRDIALVEKDLMETLEKKKSAEGFIYSSMIPGLLKTGYFLSGIMALGSIVSGSIGLMGRNAIWNYSFPAEYSIKQLEQEYDFYKSAELRDKYLRKDAPYKKDAKMLLDTPFGFIFAQGIGCAALYSYLSNKYSVYQKNNADFIQDMQARIDRDNAIIATLNILKYSLGRY